jgi:DNA-directed RNA polymerase subunit RPC12/RpoP
VRRSLGAENSRESVGMTIHVTDIRLTGLTELLLLAGMLGLVLLAILIVWWVTRRPPIGRLSAVRCRKCGYNLTGNTSGVCPECGTSFELNSEQGGPERSV